MLQLISFKGLYLFIICLDIFRFMTRLNVFKTSVGSISWGADTSAPQRQISALSAPQQIVVQIVVLVGEPTGRLSGVREQTCRLPSKLSLGSRQVGSPEHCRWGSDMSAPLEFLGLGLALARHWHCPAPGRCKADMTHLHLHLPTNLALFETWQRRTRNG